MLSDKDLERYSRQVILPQMGEEAQQKLLDSKVLLVGLGGLGCPAATYLATAGIGCITLVDDDSVELSNLARQSLYEDADIGRPKASVAAEKLAYLNPDGQFIAQNQRFDPENPPENCDIWVDATDNYDSRIQIAIAAQKQRKKLVTAAAQGFQGHITTLTGRDEDACYHGVFPTVPNDSAVSRCEVVGVLGAVTGVIGAMLAQEVIKELLSIGSSLCNEILIYDGLYNRTQKFLLTNPLKSCEICNSR